MFLMTRMLGQNFLAATVGGPKYRVREIDHPWIACEIIVLELVLALGHSILKIIRKI
jgi:hypothetical protein